MNLNREGWLTELAKHVQPMFKGFAVAEYRLTCGWPSQMALSRSKRRVGECHSLDSSKGGVHEIFISPVLEDSLEVAGTVCHELAHVAAGIKAAHKGQFIMVCRHVGLTNGKPTQVMPGEKLNESLKKIIEKLGGGYPHKSLQPKGREIVKASSSVALVCPDCGCKAYMSMKWLNKSGLPTCGCGGEMGVG